MLNSKIFTVLSITVLGFIIWVVLKDKTEVVEIKNEVKAVQSKIIELQKKNTQLSGLIDYFKSRSYQEKEARLKLNLKKPDEEVVIIQYQQEKETRPENININQSENKKKGAFEKIKIWFENLLSREIE